jgi:hypothetical protein
MDCPGEDPQHPAYVPRLWRFGLHDPFDLWFSRPPGCISNEVVAAGLSRDPALVEDWLSYSEDKRTSSGWFLTRTVDADWLVGYYPTGPRTRFGNAVEACASFVLKEMAAILDGAG